MDFEDSAGIRYQLTETVEAPVPAQKSVWPWVVGGLAVAGGLVWMASTNTRKDNPVRPNINNLIMEARDPRTSRERLFSLSSHPNQQIRKALLDNPNICPTKVDGKLDTLLLSKMAVIFPEDVAQLPLFTLHVLIEPSDDMIWVVAEVIERTTDLELIEHVWRTWGPSWILVRQMVAMNRHTPLHLLRILGTQATETEEEVRAVVGKNPSTPVELLRILGNEKTEAHWSVRTEVASNSNTPEDVLRTLGNPKTESYEKVRVAVAKNPNTPMDLLRFMSNPKTEASGWVRKAVAGNPGTPVKILRRLTNPRTEPREDVREAAKKALNDRGLS